MPPERGSTRSTLARSHRATRRRSCWRVRYAAGTSKRTPSTVTVPSLRRCLRESSLRIARRKASEPGDSRPTLRIELQNTPTAHSVDGERPVLRQALAVELPRAPTRFARPAHPRARRKQHEVLAR